ncbi:MAG: hypothetical protein ACOZEN_06145 [Thermodesulfobacteriota bacterium]
MSLPRPQKVIRKRFDVEEEDKSMTFRHGETAPIGGSSGNLFFLGLPGSGRRELAQDVAGRLGLRYTEAASAADLDAALAGSGQAVAVTQTSIVESPEAVQAMRASGRVFVLTILPHELAARLGDPSSAGELARKWERLEPLMLAAAHFILPLDESFEELAWDAVWKARL